MREFVPYPEEDFASPVSATPPSDEVMQGLHSALSRALENQRLNSDVIAEFREAVLYALDGEGELDAQTSAAAIENVMHSDFRGIGGQDGPSE